MNNNNFKTKYQNVNNSCQGISNINKGSWAGGISPHNITQCYNPTTNLIINIINTNQNSLSSLSVNYISYFYLYYPILIKIFPNLFPKSVISEMLNLIRYICCSLIKLKCYIRYFVSCISSSLTSNTSDIQSLTSLVTELPDLIKKVLCNLKTSIGLNINLLCIHITNIGCTIQCFNKEIHNTVNTICTINKLICICKTPVIQCFKDSLNQIKSSLYTLRRSLISLFDLLNPLQYYLKGSFSKSCPTIVSGLKSKICELNKRFNCSISEITRIESSINTIQCISQELKKQKQQLCKQIDKFLFYICIDINILELSFKLTYFNKEWLDKKLKCLTEKIEKICSEFVKIEDTTSKLKHSLLFNSYYLQISSQILIELECIENQQKTLSDKLSDLNNVSSHISVISDNIKEIRAVIEKMNERKDDFGYIRDILCSIFPKLSKIKDAATKIKQLQCVVNALYRIKCSIENLKDLECEQKCLEIFDFTDNYILKYTLICIKDKLEINSITIKLSNVQTAISSLESVICNINKLLGYIETIESILSVIEYLRRNINELGSSKLIKCSLLSTTNSIVRVNSLRVVELDSPVMNMYGVSNVMDYNVVVNRLFESSKKIHKIFEFIYSSYGCFCIGSFESKIPPKPDKYLGIDKYLFKYHSSDEIYKMKTVKEIKRLYELNLDGNHLCLCMIIKYVMYPSIINIVYIISFELQVLSTLSRKYENYGQTTTLNPDPTKILIMLIDILESMASWIRNKYQILWIGRSTGSELKCYCTYNHNASYSSVVSIILFVSSLIENMWSMDTQSLRMSIECLSSLTTEFEKIDSQNNKLTHNCNSTNFFETIKMLFCPLKFCTISSKLQFVLNFVSLPYGFSVLDSVIKPYLSYISLIEIFNFDYVLKHLKDMNRNSTGSYFGHLLDTYNSIGVSNNLCKQFKNQCCVLSSSIIIIMSMLISFIIRSKLYSKRCGEMKKRLCDFLELVCKCNSSECCIKQLLGSSNDVCTQINGSNGCDDLLKNCVESCCSNKC